MKNPATRARSGSSVTSVPSSKGRSRRVSPASCEPIIMAVNVAVATNPNIAQPPQSMDGSASRRLAGLGVEGGEHLRERVEEARHALVLQGGADVVDVKAKRRELLHDPGRGVDVAVDRAGDGAVILEGGDGGVGQCANGVGTDQAVDVQGVALRGLLGGRGRPQGPRQVRASGSEPVPALT